MIRTIIWFIYFWLFQLFSLPVMLRVWYLDKRQNIAARDRQVHRIVLFWSRSLIRLTGSKIKVTGRENVPTDGAVLFVSNHQGRFDIPLILGYIDKPKAFIAKKELAKLPMVSSWMKYMKCIFMDRQDIRQSLKAINQGAEYLKEGYSQVIFPEGTRSRDGRLGEFKAGSFKLATKSGVPIIPVTIKGSDQIMPNNTLLLRPAQVEMVISPPVDPEKFSGIKELASYVRGIVAEQLGPVA